MEVPREIPLPALSKYLKLHLILLPWGPVYRIVRTETQVAVVVVGLNTGGHHRCTQISLRRTRMGFRL